MLLCEFSTLEQPATFLLSLGKGTMLEGVATGMDPLCVSLGGLGALKALVPLSLDSLGEGRDFQETASKVAFGKWLS